MRCGVTRKDSFFTVRKVFTCLGLYPKSGPLKFCEVISPFSTPSCPTAELSSANHTCFTLSFAVSVLSACISGHMDIAYIAIAALSPRVIPSCDSILNQFSINGVTGVLQLLCDTSRCRRMDIAFYSFLG